MIGTRRESDDEPVLIVDADSGGNTPNPIRPGAPSFPPAEVGEA